MRGGYGRNSRSEQLREEDALTSKCHIHNADLTCSQKHNAQDNGSAELDMAADMVDTVEAHRVKSGLAASITSNMRGSTVIQGAVHSSWCHPLPSHRNIHLHVDMIWRMRPARDWLQSTSEQRLIPTVHSLTVNKSIKELCFPKWKETSLQIVISNISEDT